MQGRKPNLFLIGAMKSGTTYLSKLLNLHPAIFMSTPEEPSYFVQSEQLKKLWPAMWDRGIWRSEDRYLNLFEGAGDAIFLGEASTNYTKLPLVSGVSEKIYKFNSDARFIYLIRDPVDRTLSHYWHSVRYHANARTIICALMEDKQFTDVSHYSMQVLPFLDRFDKSRVHVLTYEELTDNPRRTLSALYDWLGIGGAFVDDCEFDRPENVTPEVVRMATGFGLLPRLRQSRLGRVAVRQMPLSIRRMGLAFATTEVRRSSVDATEAVKYLQHIQRRQTYELSRLLGRKFAEWTTLHQELPH
jgi:hypothetical protein